MKVAIASDHGGYELKQKVIEFLKNSKIEFKDFGSFSTGSVDYPDIAIPCAEAVAKGEYDRGIIICGRDRVCISANKVKGIRTALCHDVFPQKMSRRHNNANILTMGGRVIGSGHALCIVKAWLEEEFDGDRHKRRIDKIKSYEELS